MPTAAAMRALRRRRRARGDFAATTAAARSTASSSSSARLHRVAGARLEHLLVGAEHRAEGDVLEAHGRAEPAGEPRGREHHRQVLRLRRADHVDERAARPASADAVAERREIGRGVAVAAVLLAHDERQRLAVAAREAGREDADARPRSGAPSPCALELGDDVGQGVVVESSRRRRRRAAA